MSTYIRPLKAKKISHYITIRMPLESKVQGSIISFCKRKGFKVVKLISTSKNGIADLLILTPGKHTIFCEVKKLGKEPDPLQVYRMDELSGYCTGYFYADSLSMFKDKLLTISL